MNFNETGFRPFYHHVCALELNEELRGRLQECPQIGKASHAVVYGFIDREKGLMLEVLGAGKQATKYFYFRDPYEGPRITIRIGEVADVPFVWFEKLEPRFEKLYVPAIKRLKQDEVPKDLEESRTFAFLDGCREPAYPDDVRVLFIREGLKTEECWVRISGLGEHVLIGTLLNQPYQDFGVGEGDTVRFSVREEGDGTFRCVVDFSAVPAREVAEGILLKKAVAGFHREKTAASIQYAISVLKSSRLVVSCEIELSREARAIWKQMKEEGKDLDDLDENARDRFYAGLSYVPALLKKNDKVYFPIFSGEDELNEEFRDGALQEISFSQVLEMAENNKEVDGIVLNPFTESFVIMRNHFAATAKVKPIVPEETVEDAPTVLRTGAEGRSTGDIRMDVGKMDVFNYALYQNNVPAIRGIRIFNGSGDPVEGLSLRIHSDFPFFREYETPLPAIPSGKPVELEDPRLLISGKTLADLTEAVTTTITVELRKDDRVVCGCRGQMQVLAYDQWLGGDSYRDLLTAFILPNHPAVAALMHDAADRLAKWGKPSSLEGYQRKDPNRVRDLAAAVYAAIQKKNIVYAEPPASFSVPGQRIRTPETVLSQRLGTCMDMTLLYAACLEAMGLHPLLVLMKGHIFAGVWLRERSVDELKGGNTVIDNLDELKKRIDNGSDEMTFIECVAMCSGNQASFEEAEKAAKLGHLTRPDQFRFAIDVHLARTYGIKPIPVRTKDGGNFGIETEDRGESEITAAPDSLDISVAHTGNSDRKITTKKDLWESKLLDLSQHNMLLNLPHNASVMPIMSSHISELEDALADGHEFRILPAADWITGIAFAEVDENGKEGVPVPWLPKMIKKRGIFELTKWPVGTEFDCNEKFLQEYRNHRLYTFCGEKQLDRELTTIYRAARSSQQENGVSSLYLAIGLMRWFEDPQSESPSYAPLILFPIEIIRKSANQGYGLHARDEEPHFNATLLEMLKQNDNLEIAGLDPLPTDAHGIDIRKVFAIVRGALYPLKGWDVVESCVIGNFSFAQFAMWNDIHTAGPLLDSSKVVRSLMKGHIDWDVRERDNPEEENTYLPITVDATQLQAIRMVNQGRTFVLHGPPGTGKSQTITGMIANLLANGKKVLFVAEKMAALSVVQKRLSTLGIGDFCLELHSDKANKKQVLTQLERALAIKHPALKTDYEEQLRKVEASKAKLDDYQKHLHAVHHCGYSLRDLIDLYETVREEEKFIRFDADLAGQLSREQLDRHVPLLEQLSAAGDAVGDVKSHPLAGIGLTSYGADIRSAVRRNALLTQDALMEVKEAGKECAALLGMAMPKEKREYAQLVDLLGRYDELKHAEPECLDEIEENGSAIEAWFEADRHLRTEETRLLGSWKKDFLTQDMNHYLARHEAAGKKFFGKAAAMAALVSELQVYALESLSFETIPEKLQEIARYQSRKQSVLGLYRALPDGARKVLEHFQVRRNFLAAVNKVKEYRKQTDLFPGGLNAIRALNRDPGAGHVFADYKAKYTKALEAEQRLNDLLVRMPNEALDWVEEEGKFCRILLQGADTLKDWGLYNQIRQECIRAGLGPAVEAVENGLDKHALIPAYRKGICYALINEIILSDDVLSSFSGVTFNESIRQFKRLNEEMLQQTKREIYYLLASRVPTPWDSPEVGMELNLLRKAIGGNARGMSIRTLFERIPHILQTLCPCMLMSPNSVAQYLAQESDMFDVVIFDEASQLPTCKAIGALCRARDAVIVGDPKQMPPTAFFAGGGSNVEDLALDDLDSILDDALALGIPSQYLQWHYRSTHESLIAFSNSHFYDNRMYTFPSANDRERHVTVVHVEGVYKNSINISEAEAVAGEIVRRFHDPDLRKQSIGVVTFNVKQQTLIENLLAKQFQMDPDLDRWANEGENALFVKNLENVQGDERDVILFSIGYGPDEKGKISMNFGPINKPGGGKRLNVAFSRARVTMTIYSSIHSSDIRITENSPEGLVAFRDFLKFAEGHELRQETTDALNGRIANEGILQSIRSAIEDQGFQCIPMVGHSDFHVDLAVVDPCEPTRYLMGILLDGNGYKETRNTRDREVAQIGVLRNLGWTLHRVWTIDWWDNWEKVLKKILSLLADLKEASQKKHEAAAARAAELAAEQEKRKEQETALQAELDRQVTEVIADEQESEMSEKERARSSEPAGQTMSPVDQPMPKARVTSEEIHRAAEPAPEVMSPSSRDQPAQTTDKPEPTAGREPEHRSPAEPAEKEEKREPKPEMETLTDLLRQLEAAKAELVDKRANGGALWVVGNRSLRPIMQAFKALGVHFTFKAGGGKATNGRDGWWAKTDLVLPGKDEMETSAVPAKTEPGPVEAGVTGTEAHSDEPAATEPDQIPPTESADSEAMEANNLIESETEEAGEITPVPYTFATLPENGMSPAEYTAAGNKAEIGRRALAIIEAEAPILKEVLIRRLMASFGVNRSAAVLDATEKALKAVKIKSTRQKGMVVYWADDQDPKAYSGLRVSNERSGEEICPQELRNAIVYTLRTKGELPKDALVKEASVVLGYKRLGKNLEAALIAGVQYARSTGAIICPSGGVFKLP